MSDLISRQAAIDVMCELMHHWFGGDPKDEIREIKRELEKLPSAQPVAKDINVPAKDCISRQAAIDEIRRCRFVVDAIEKISKLPSAQQEPKKGHWVRHPEQKNIYGGKCVECSECGEKYTVQYIQDEKFCRNCGADMRGDQNELN